VRLSPQQRQDNQTRIRAVMDAILSGDLPPGGKCDTSTLARQAGFSELKTVIDTDRLAVAFPLRGGWP
jgi:DNA-binding GntR family transcriptional regulator